ncbi:serine threonine- phosphatase 5 isoform X1 [Olea europaea subsp. europaea]|uniref:Serine threonine- phosphatase 5 isoform X1 n=1 Tax=Olea europaea subsp. europaea TaxID=158383 RepID=A0A8S0U4U4_OLEEU|nr:serine threonine- phosphatase 5 isoform X1 [Olea europaea subsp. europaea]
MIMLDMGHLISALLIRYVVAGMKMNAESLFHKMRNAGYASDEASFYPMLKFYEDLKHDDKVELMISKMIEENIPLGLFKEAETFVNQMIEAGIKPSPDTWEILAKIHIQERSISKALSCLGEAFLARGKGRERCCPCPKAVTSILEICEEGADMASKYALFEMFKEAVAANSFLSSSGGGLYSVQMGNKGAFIHFEAPNLKPNIVTFTAMPHPDVKPMAYANNFLLMFSLIYRRLWHRCYLAGSGGDDGGQWKTGCGGCGIGVMLQVVAVMMHLRL